VTPSFVKHAFVLNCHKDVPQAIRVTGLLKRYFSRSKVFLYIDGNTHSQEQLHLLEGNCGHLHVGDYEPNKCQSIINALNHLILAAGDAQIEVASFLHTDMIPTDLISFYHFIDRFYRANKLISLTPIWPGTSLIDFCNLHFRVAEAVKNRLIPATRIPMSNPGHDYNENQVTQSFNRSSPGWEQNAYLMWTIVIPFDKQYVLRDAANNPIPIAKIGHSVHGQFVVHNFTPESSVIHTNTQWFWDHYENIAKFD
jgi:hypothetical protein